MSKRNKGRKVPKGKRDLRIERMLERMEAFRIRNLLVAGQVAHEEALRDD